MEELRLDVTGTFLEELDEQNQEVEFRELMTNSVWYGIVLTANYIAKQKGVKTGMALWQAKQICPEIIFVPPRMDLYLRFSKMAREIYSEYTDKIEPYGIDEAWLDVSDSRNLKGSGMTIAREISHG